MAMKVYFLSGSPYAWRVMLALTVKGLEYETVLLDRAAGDLETEEYKALNPYGKVPVLVDGDVTLSESLAILTYLEKAYPDTPLLSAEPAASATTVRRILELDNYEISEMRKFLFPLFTGAYAEHKEEADAGLLRTKENLIRFDALLGNSKYLEGATFTLFDLSLYPAIALSQRVLHSPTAAAIDTGGLLVSESYPNIAAWMARIEAIEDFAKTYPPHWRAAEVA